jgi:mono/diheme cytochrome c family protein
MLRLLSLVPFVACVSQSAGDPTVAKIHLGEAWFELRGRHLGISTAEAARRDGDIDHTGPPADAFWDDQVATEAASVWRMLCNECHGGKRSIAKAKEIPPPPDGFGTREGPFFGKARPEAEIFQVIFHGIEKEDAENKMPPWGDRLAREQIWALVWFLEHASADDVHLLPEASNVER